jgi:hypothetical protein
MCLKLLDEGLPNETAKGSENERKKERERERERRSSRMHIKRLK